MKKLLYVLIVLALFLGYVAYPLINDKPSESNQTATTEKEYPLLAKRLFVENPNNIRINFNPLRQALNTYMKNNGLEGSIYFEYLPTGTSIRVNGDEQEVVASLIKLPAAMELYKAAELGKVNLNDKVKLKAEWLDGGFGELYKKGAGYELSYRDLTKIMLKDSDNTALKAIALSIQGILPIDQSPFQFLDIDFTQNSDFTVSVSARSYSSFLKCLYFSCYVSEQSSQELLTYLTESNFDTRLLAGIDKNVQVAHKIGTFSDTTQSDCGIVYVDRSNYAICVMIDGPDDPSTDEHIAAISRLAYAYVTDTSK